MCCWSGEFPIGGKAHERRLDKDPSNSKIEIEAAQDAAEFRSRRYSPDKRRNALIQPGPI